VGKILARADRAEAERRGRRAEALAALYLRCKGWRILGSRLKTRVGEVDLVARRGKVLAFVEVKSRATMAQAEISLDQHRLRRVADAASLLLPRFQKDAEVVRIDAIYIVPGCLPRHLQNVWQG
jgi:putative endonuclease